MENLVFNLNKGTLGEYQIDVKEPSHFNGNYHQDFKQGYGVYLSNNKVSSLVAYFRSGYSGFKSFKGLVVINDKSLSLDQNTTYDEIISAFGKPSEEWNDGVERCVMYTLNKMEIEIIWHVDSFLSLDYISLEVFDED